MGQGCIAQTKEYQMSRLDKFTESERQFIQFSNDIKLIINKCQPFMKELVTKVRPIEFLLSGRKGKGDFFEGRVRFDRKAKDTNPKIHNDLNDEFQRQFGYPARSNSIFCTGSDMTAESYGVPYMIFPIGKYKYLWNPDIEDLYIYINRELSDFNKDISKSYRENTLLQYFVDKHTLKSDGNYEFSQYYENSDEKDDLDFMQFHFEYFLKWADDQLELSQIKGRASYDEFLQHIVGGYRSDNLKGALADRGEIMLTCNKYFGWSMEYMWDLESYLKTFGYKGHSDEDDARRWWKSLGFR